MIKFFTNLAIFVIFISCSGSDDSSDYYNSGKKSYYNKDLDSAIEYFQKAIKKDENLISSRIMLGKCYYYKGEFEESLKIFDELLDKYPGNADAYYWKGRNLLNIPSKQAESKVYFIKSIQAGESQIDAHYYLAKYYENDGDVKRALMELNNALGIKSKFDKVHKDLADIYIKSGFEERAKSHIKQN